MTAHRAVLMIAARAPVAGETKTRLGQTIGMERAAALYRGFLRDLGARFPAADAPYDLAWTYSPPACDFRSVLIELGIPIHERVRFVAQQGNDWGERQTHLLRWATTEYERALLIASDSPHLDAGVITDAFARLERHEMVFGRTRDGGYYLIGMRGFHDVLSGVPMSTTSAADALAARAAILGLAAVELPETFDIDNEGDLELLIDALKRDETLAPATLAALRAERLVPF